MHETMTMLLWVVITTVGCAGEVSESGGSGSGGEVTAPRINGTVLDLMTAQPVANVEVCVLDHAALPCASTGADGTYLLDNLPLDSHIEIETTAPDHTTIYWPYDTARGSQSVVSSIATVGDTVLIVQAAIGKSPDPSLGMVLFAALEEDGGGLAGVTVNEDMGTALGPVYFGEGGIPSLSLQQTSTNGGGVLIDVALGPVDVTFAGSAGTTCTPTWGWSGATAASVELDVRAQALALATASCE